MRWRAGTAGWVLAGGLALGGCGGVAVGGDAGGDAGGAVGSPTPSVPTAGPSATAYDPVARCVSQVGYWTPIALREDADGGLDYQEMGLSGTTYAALRVVVADAAKQSPAPDTGWVTARATTACTQALASAGPRPSGPGWP